MTTEPDGQDRPGDPRTIRTRARLRAALLAECEQRPLDQVSLSAVARRAGVGRATLYLHYEGLQALAVDACADVVRQGVDALHAWTGAPSPDAPPAPLTDFLVAVHRRAALYRALLPDGAGGPLGTLLHRELRARSHAERVRAGAPYPDLAAAATAATFTGLLADWLHGQVELSPEDFARHVWRLLLAVHRTIR
ncbi:TetR/AcrR family transcriptional regulator [Streptomyces sp. NBC_01476]|uniref:TetR/AcrR family transcriptional regulator n=1 Tax=Streptomyces sp. NBC_01476 TaxID=2903881 RepID=UPI002E309717|nr:helix-turn-helix domain-containing protein [Streptomyces sp. NBC_01476]